MSFFDNLRQFFTIKTVLETSDKYGHYPLTLVSQPGDPVFRSYYWEGSDLLFRSLHSRMPSSLVIMGSAAFRLFRLNYTKQYWAEIQRAREESQDPALTLYSLSNF